MQQEHFVETITAAGLPKSIVDKLKDSRALSKRLAENLSDEDMVVQAMDDASPAKWHLAHTTWFYESFILDPFLPGYKNFSEEFSYCFNSYYESKGDRHPRPHRGLLTRPSSSEVLAYRAHVDVALDRLVATLPDDENQIEVLSQLLDVGINHEQQHQELMLTDILALFARQPLKPAYQPRENEHADTLAGISDVRWRSYRGGVCEIGHAGGGFCYDNEGPRHHVLLHPFKLATRCVTNAEWMAFMEDGGYREPLLWLSDGWSAVRQNSWQAPEYWQREDGQWHQMTLSGLIPVEGAAPVSHVSYYEADAFARWAGKRLPTEFEWELAAGDTSCSIGANTLGTGRLRPAPVQSASADQELSQMIGDVWEWTSSAYQAYPGYRPPKGALGEYNGKFMCSQFVLRGGSCVTPDGHIRRTYRNFFYPHQRWQFMGLRLADDT